MEPQLSRAATCLIIYLYRLPSFLTSSFSCWYFLVRPSYIICRVQCKLKLQGSLLKSYYEFQDADSTALNQAQDPSETGPEWVHRLCAYEAGAGTGIPSQRNYLYFPCLGLCIWGNPTDVTEVFHKYLKMKTTAFLLIKCLSRLYNIFPNFLAICRLFTFTWQWFCDFSMRRTER